jgi:selenide, water dikinase
VLAKLPKVSDPRLIVGTQTFDDAGVVRLDDKTALVQTVDFFTPIVDDPYDFGRIAAANALSDVYAMGGTPLTALAICAFPVDALDMDVLAKTLAGGMEVLRKANVLLVGGHTVKGPEFNYGLAVTGLVSPERVLTNAGARLGDVLVLTKPLGTGVLATALKHEQLQPELEKQMIASMVQLNAGAAAATVGLAVHAMTDITGFGLLGHLMQLAAASGVALEIDSDRVPLLAGARSAAENGHIPGGLRSNYDWIRDRLVVDGAEPILVDLFCDPQTSGGLVIAIAATDADSLLAACAARSVSGALIGRVVSGASGHVHVRG